MKCDAKIVDVKTAFLFGDLDEEVCMTCKEVHEGDDVSLLMHSICGLVQSACQCHMKFKEKLNKIGFEGGHPDPCLLVRKNKNGAVHIAVWVDDSLLIGDEEAIGES